MNNHQALHWVDKARVWASFAVVVIHVNSIFINVYSKEVPGFWTTSVFTGSLVRWSVPLFVMLSGFLLLSSKPENFNVFINKKLKRILYPLIGWCMVYYLYFFFRVQYLDASPLDFKNQINNFLLGKPYYHLYFLFLILGLYLITPALKLFVQYADKLLVKYLAMFSIVVAIVPVALDYFLSRDLFSAAVMDNDNMFNYFIQYTGYFLAGFYIVKYVSINSANILKAWLLLIFSIAVTILGSYYYHNTGYFYSYLSGNVICMSLAVFYMFMYYSHAANKVSEKIIRFIAPNTLGIYLIHPIIFELFPGLHKISFELGPVLATLVVVVVVYCVSLLLIMIARKLPVIKLIT